MIDITWTLSKLLVRKGILNLGTTRALAPLFPAQAGSLFLNLFNIMDGILEHIFVRTWNWFSRLRHRALKGGLFIGSLVVDGRVTKKPIYIPQVTRAEHIVIAGKTGTGKSFFLRNCVLQDIRAGRGFLCTDYHNDLIPFIHSAIAAEEKRAGQDLSHRLIPIEPANTEFSVGINPLQASHNQDRFVRNVGLVALLKERLGLEQFGAPTEELLRNSLYVLSENGLTLLELPPLLTHSPFRAQCLKRVTNPDVRDFFVDRFEQMSDAMKAVRREPVLNKIAEFVSDPHFKFIIGQRQSTFSMSDAMDQGAWITVDGNKARLGKHSTTFGSLIFAQAANAIFRRACRDIFSIYCDEIQNLLTKDSEIDVLLAEARKFGVSVVSANQFSEQIPLKLRSAMGAVGTRIYFQLSGSDAQEAATVMDGGKVLAELLKNLPKRNFVAKTGHYSWLQVEVPTLAIPQTDYSDLLRRARLANARRREDIERDIATRRPQAMVSTKEALNAWE